MAEENGEAIIDTGIRIAVPIDRVWDILVAYDRYGDWNPYIVRIDGKAVAGTAIEVHSTGMPGGSPTAAPVDVVSVEPYRMRWEGGLADRSQFRGDHFFDLTAVDPITTHFRHYERFSGTLARRILDAHGGLIEANFVRFNTALQRHAERPRSTL